MTKKLNAEPPEGLTKTATEWWRKMVAEFEFDDPNSFELLHAAAIQIGRSEYCRDLIAKEGGVVRDRFDQPREHPAVSMERQASNLFRLLTRELGVTGGTDEVSRIPRNGKGR